MAEKTIEIKDLVVEYRTRSGVVQALNGLSLSIEKGKTLGLVGETGAGKTTAGLAVLGLIPSPPGAVSYTHLDVYKRQVPRYWESADPGSF